MYLCNKILEDACPVFSSNSVKIFENLTIHLGSFLGSIQKRNFKTKWLEL